MRNDWREGEAVWVLTQVDPRDVSASGGRGLNGQPIQIIFALEVRVETWLAAGARIEQPRPASCPACGHTRVCFDGTYRRQTRRGPVRIQRLLCGGATCAQRSHSLLPDVLVSGRVDLASVIGRALEAKAAGAGHRPIAGHLGVPAATVRHTAGRLLG